MSRRHLSPWRLIPAPPPPPHSAALFSRRPQSPRVDRSPGSSMVLYNLAGRVNSEEFAICERLLDILSVSLPDIQVAKTAYHQTKWPAEAAAIAQTYGFRVPTAAQAVVCDVIVWTETGRLLSTDADAFSTFALQHYGVQLDLNESEVMMHVKANVDELRKQQKQHQVPAR